MAVVPVQVAVQQPDAVGGGERAECQAADQRAEPRAAESSAPNWSALAKYRTARITTGGQIVPVTTTTAAKPTPIPTNIRTQTPTMTASRPPAKFNTADAAPNQTVRYIAPHRTDERSTARVVPRAAVFAAPLRGRWPPRPSLRHADSSRQPRHRRAARAIGSCTAGGIDNASDWFREEVWVPLYRLPPASFDESAPPAPDVLIGCWR